MSEGGRYVSLLTETLRLRRAVFGLLATWGCSLLTCAPSPPDRPNVILIVVDTLRASHLADYGYELAADTDSSIEALAQPTPVEMRAGSVIFFAGTLLHRGGANRSSAIRRAFSHQYCEPWARQQEHFTLSIPRERAKAMSTRLRQMLGYSILPPFMGQIAGRHPEKALTEDYVNSLIADGATIAGQRG